MDQLAAKLTSKIANVRNLMGAFAPEAAVEYA
jgi:hypothetical protein